MTSSTSSSAAGAPSRDPVPRRGPTVALGLVALLLVAAGWSLPLWQATLLAPQYPGGLSMSAYGHQVTGDVEEIDTLNHYVGMRAFDPETVPEMGLWPLALAVAVVAVVVGLTRRRGVAGKLARLYLWGLPVGVLAMIQFRLHQYGTDLDPAAALRLDPFTPWVVGPTKVWNFTTWSRPGLGLVAIAVAAALVSFGPRLLVRRRVVGAATALVVLPALLLAGAPAYAAEGYDHSGHGGGAEAPAGGAVDRAPRIGPATSGTGAPITTDHPDAGDLADVLARQPAGGRLALPAGTYRGPVVIDRPITIEGRDLPILQGDGTGSVLTVRAPGTVIRGLVIRGSGPGPTDNPAAIRVEADDVTIEGVVVQDSYAGIAVDGAARVRLVDNHIHGRAHADLADDGHAVSDDGGDAHADHAQAVGATGGRGDGIWLHDAEAVLIRGNHIEDTRDGVYLSFGSDSLIDGNHVHGARYAVHSMFTEHLTLAENHVSENLSGAVLMYGGEVLLLRNHIERSSSASTGFGILLKDVVGVQAVENVLVDNTVGIHLEGPAGADAETRFTANTVARNAIGVQAYSSASAEFKANSFVENALQVVPQGGRLTGITWAAEGWGNHWSTYGGYDALGQGRGAVPHTEGGSVDRLLVRNPELLAIAESPALRLLRSVEQRWGQRTPVLTDELPLTRPVSPALDVPAPEPAARLLGTALGALLLLPAVATFVRRSRRASAPSRRFLRAVSI